MGDVQRWFTSVLIGPALVAGVQASSHEDIARRWAPIIYKDFAHEFTHDQTGFNPVDFPLDLFFDQNDNLRDNSESVFRLDQAQISALVEEPSIYYSVIESTTHYYITYILYHAIDFKAFGHSHDLENIWTVVEKGRGAEDRLIAQITNVHGYPMIYAPSADREQRWREKVSHGLAWRVFPFLDAHSRVHREVSAEYFEDSKSQRLSVFVSSRSHAIYGWSREAWMDGRGSGGVFVERSCRSCQDSIALKSSDRSFTYQLRSWDQAMKRMRASWESLSSNDNPLPRYLPAGYEEQMPRANLFHTTSFKTPHRLADPIWMHTWFEGDPLIARASYLYNPYFSAQATWAQALFSRR